MREQFRLDREYLHSRRLWIVKQYLGGKIADLDLGTGRSPKGKISLDIDGRFKPNIVADVNHLPIRSESVNSVVCSHVIEHVNNVNRVLVEINRILKKDGLVFFFLPNDGSTLWRAIKSFWTIYYEKLVSKKSSPETHVHSFDGKNFRECIERFFEPFSLGKMNMGMEIYAVCKRCKKQANP